MSLSLRCSVATLVLLSVAGCEPGASVEDVTTGLAVLGDGTHALDAVNVDVMLTAEDGLATPMDLAFNTDADDELWVVNRRTHAMVVSRKASTDRPRVSLYVENISGQHFMARPSGIAFGKAGFFATSHEEDAITQPDTPADFMGPTLWTSDLDEFDAGHASHYDMLHNSPNSLGIAWEKRNVYWIYDGEHGSITRYDFAQDHGPGGADHTDGIVERYLDGEMGYRARVPANMVFDPDADILFASDPKKGRVIALDVTSGKAGSAVGPNYDGSDQSMVRDAVFEVVGDLGAAGVTSPSGLALSNGLLFVADYDTGRIVAMSPAGDVIDWLDTGVAEGLGGLTVHADGSLWVADVTGSRVLRVSAGQAGSL